MHLVLAAGANAGVQAAGVPGSEASHPALHPVLSAFTSRTPGARTGFEKAGTRPVVTHCSAWLRRPHRGTGRNSGRAAGKRQSEAAERDPGPRAFTPASGSGPRAGLVRASVIFHLLCIEYQFLFLRCYSFFGIFSKY